MTRINCVPVSELSSAHLGAEYRELPRIYGLVRSAMRRGCKPEAYAAFNTYRLGTGHCLFFYTRLSWLDERYAEVAAECARRGRRVSFPRPPSVGIPREWFGGWEPAEADLTLNRRRIQERGGSVGV